MKILKTIYILVILSLPILLKQRVNVYQSKLLFLFLFFAFWLSLLKGQGKTIESLKYVLANAKHDTIKVKLLSELSEVCEIIEIEKYAEPCVNLFEQESIINYVKKNKQFLKYLSGAHSNLAYFAQNKGEVAVALRHYKICLSIDESINDLYGKASTLNNIGRISEDLGDIKHALELFYQSLSIREKIGDLKGCALVLNNIGYIYDNQRDVNKALEYYNKSLLISTQINDIEWVNLTLNNIGSIYDDLENFSLALNYYSKSLANREQMNDEKGMAISLNNIGSVYRKKGDNKLALDYFKRSLEIQLKINDKKGIAYSFGNIGTVFLKLGNLNEALQYGLKAMKLANELGYPENIKNTALLLKEIYKEKNDYKNTFEMYELEIQMRDSINNAETRKAGIKKQFQYQYEKKAAADSVKNAEAQKVKNAQLIAQQAQLKQEQTQRYALYGGLGLVLAFSGFVYNRFRLTQRQKTIIENQKYEVDSAYEKLHEKNKEVMDSIRYAARIQRSLITSEKYIKQKLNRGRIV